MSNENVKLNFAHICENAFLSKTKNINIIQGFDSMIIKRRAPGKPLFANFYIVTNFTAEVGKKYTQEISIVDVSNDEIIKRTPVEQQADKEKIGLILKFGIGFSKPGAYKVVIKLGRDVFNELPLKIIEKPTEER